MCVLLIAARGGLHVLGIVFLDFLRILFGELSSICTLLLYMKILVFENNNNCLDVKNGFIFAMNQN